MLHCVARCVALCCRVFSKSKLNVLQRVLYFVAMCCYLKQGLNYSFWFVAGCAKFRKQRRQSCCKCTHIRTHTKQKTKTRTLSLSLSHTHTHTHTHQRCQSCYKHTPRTLSVLFKHTHTHTHTNAHTFSLTYSHMHTYACAHTRTYRPTHTHTHTHSTARVMFIHAKCIYYFFGRKTKYLLQIRYDVNDQTQKKKGL